MRFVSADDLIPEQGNPQAWNRYSYVLGNPVFFTDPTGHVVCEDAWGDNCGPDPHALSTLAKASTPYSSTPQSGNNGSSSGGRRTEHRQDAEDDPSILEFRGVRVDFTGAAAVIGFDINLDFLDFKEALNNRKAPVGRINLTVGWQVGSLGASLNIGPLFTGGLTTPAEIDQISRHIGGTISDNVAINFLSAEVDYDLSNEGGIRTTREPASGGWRRWG